MFRIPLFRTAWSKDTHDDVCQAFDAFSEYVFSNCNAPEEFSEIQAFFCQLASWIKFSAYDARFHSSFMAFNDRLDAVPVAEMSDLAWRAFSTVCILSSDWGRLVRWLQNDTFSSDMVSTMLFARARRMIVPLMAVRDSEGLRRLVRSPEFLRKLVLVHRCVRETKAALEHDALQVAVEARWDPHSRLEQQFVDEYCCLMWGVTQCGDVSAAEEIRRELELLKREVNDGSILTLVDKRVINVSEVSVEEILDRYVEFRIFIGATMFSINYCEYCAIPI